MKQPIRKLKVPDSVAEVIRNLHPHLKKKIKASLQSIITDSCLGKALKDELAGMRSFRVSRFRIIYRVSDQKLIEIIAIGPRECIYEDTFRLLKRKEDIGDA
ncbi:MAG: type II toxin-antitoxin system RelE/ParE family toxin [Candidatus Brocadiales bacterium]|nr:type II toxin-antitoxin system RelE/ParE family toxin [Candidatus Brocadiales bacterium]